MPYLFDAEGVSVMGGLWWGEDNFYVLSFFLDVLFYFVVLTFIYYLVEKIRICFLSEQPVK